MRITCLHTADSNISVFEAAAKALSIAPHFLQHKVRPDLLAEAERAGKLTADIAKATQLELISLAEKSDVVVLTCSTLGPAVEGITAAAPILRADEALAVAAIQTASAGGKIVVLCAVETTLEPTSRLFLDVAQQSKASIEVQLVSGAWALFKLGDNEGYLTTIAKAVDRSYLDGASVIALGQASMGGAAALTTVGPLPLTSAIEGLKAAVKSASTASGATSET